MSNITNLNRDYLIKINVKEATIDVPKMTFWNTDKKTSNMFVQLVINMSTNELISNYVTVQNATDYKITLNVIKPKTNQYKTIEATLLNEEKALFEIDLPDEYKDQVGNYNFEFEVSSKVDGNDESITTSNGTYKVNGSILTNLNEETSSSPDLPILKQLIEQVKSLQGGDLTGYQKKSDNSLETTSKEVVGAINEVNSQFKDIAKKIESGNIGNNVEPQLMDMPRIYFSEGTLPTTKTATMMKFDYHSKTTEYHGWAEIKCQGNSSMSYPKKNFTIKLYKDKAKTQKLKIDFKGWGKQSKFVLKANWIDITHARNIVSARIWGDIVKSRSDYTNLPELLRTSPNQGAVDGFPVTVYGNGYYQGRYTLNIPKDKWMSNMDDTLDTHCILCGESYRSGCFRALPAIDGSDWTDELHDVVPASIKTSWTNAITFVMNSSDSEFKANLHNYFDVNSLIDYLLYGIVSTGFDAFGKNQIYMTYDGTEWIASMYDMDSTWGLWWNGGSFVSNTYGREEFQDFKEGQGNLLYIRLKQLFINKIKARYTELKQNIFTYPYLINKFEEFMQICPQDVVKEDYANTTANNAYTGIPSKTTNNIQQIRANIKARLDYMDTYINSLVEYIPCTAITLDKSTLSFTTSDTQTLTALLTPTDTTDTVTWSASPTGVCKVVNGVITPISNGNCIITATCGSKSATCSVTVSGIATHYTITNNLTNCTNSNSATIVEENSNYSATISALDGYTLVTTIITMGGTDITSTAYSNGTITITNVTGNIIITATAEEYVEPLLRSDGVAYINTGVVPTNNTKVVLKMKDTSNKAGNNDWGAYFGATKQFRIIRNGQSANSIKVSVPGQEIAYNFNYQFRLDESSLNENAKLSDICIIELTKNYIQVQDLGVTEDCIYGNPSKLEITTTRDITTTQPITIFSSIDSESDSSTARTYADYDLYYLKIYEGEELVRDFVPAKDGETVCLYDNITKQYYKNINTSGQFTYVG